MKIQQAAESFLSCVSLRLIHDEERERFDQVIWFKLQGRR